MSDLCLESFVALSCLNVGVGPGGTTSMVARVAIVNYRGAVIFDRFVRPTLAVTDYRTSFTNITAENLTSDEAWPFCHVQQEVANQLKGKILVGHCLWNDLSVLGIPHLAVDTRDVGLYMPFRNSLRTPHTIIGLQTLAWQFLRRRCQQEHQHPVSDANSFPYFPKHNGIKVENARVAMDLYRSAAREWEESISKRNWPCALPPSTFSRCYL